jgi:hypothetical protein
MTPITDPARARRVVDFWADEGVTSYKIYMNVSHARCSRCDRSGARAWAQGDRPPVLDHLSTRPPRWESTSSSTASSSPPISAPTRSPTMSRPRRGRRALLALAADAPEMTELITTLVKRNVVVTSTLAVFAAGVVDWFPATDDLAMLNEKSQFWGRLMRTLAMRYRAPEQRARRDAASRSRNAPSSARFVARPANARDRHRSNRLGRHRCRGRAITRALRLLVAAGFSPLEVIRMATAEGARTQGVDERVGTLRAGKQADLLLVNGNPDEDIAPHRPDPILVFKNGIAYDPARLRDSVRGKIGR